MSRKQTMDIKIQEIYKQNNSSQMNKKTKRQKDKKTKRQNDKKTKRQKD